MRSKVTPLTGSQGFSNQSPGKTISGIFEWTTTPSLTTSSTCLSLPMSFNGFPVTAIKSATFPDCSTPMVYSHPRIDALVRVDATITSPAGIPPCTINSISMAFSP